MIRDVHSTAIDNGWGYRMKGIERYRSPDRQVIVKEEEWIRERRRTKKKTH